MSHPSSPLRGAIERLSGYLDDLLAERRPRRFLAQSAEELRLLKAAARLRGARPGADRPDPAFLADLRRQLAAAEGGRRKGTGRRLRPLSALRSPLASPGGACWRAWGGWWRRSWPALGSGDSTG